jgi:hypothetical protein
MLTIAVLNFRRLVPMVHCLSTVERKLKNLTGPPSYFTLHKNVIITTCVFFQGQLYIMSSTLKARASATLFELTVGNLKVRLRE